MNPDLPRNRSGEAGFTLMEILAALTVFLVGVVGVISLLTSGTHLHRSSQRLEAAGDLVGEVVLMAERDLRAAGTDAESGLPIPPDEALPIPGHEGMFYSWGVRSGEDGPPYLLTVEVFWQEGGNFRSIEHHQVLHELKSQTQVIRSRS